MSKPLSNPQTSSWMERVLAKTRDALRRVNPAVGVEKNSRGWMIALVVCALLVAGISLTSIAKKRQSKNVGTLAAEKTSGTKTAAVPAKIEEKQTAKRNDKKLLAAVKSVQTKRDSRAEKDGEKRTEAGIQLRPEVQLSPSDLAAKAGEGEQESGEEVRARASWFFDQRAYPNKHIPADALQKAIDQRDLMRQQQRAAFKPAAGAQAIISFPGDALWHLMGPQPINTPFGQNSGFPTASGRVTAIAVDPTNANIAYIGGAAGGVWKTTDGGTTWTPLTDSQPALAVGSIAIDPNSCSPGPCTTIYVGTGEDNFNGDAFYGVGILKSTDGGNTWTQLGASHFAGAQSSGTGGAQIGAIAVQPGNSSIVLASVFFFDGSDPNGGVWRSTDGGTTWVRPTTGAQGSAGTGVFFESPVNAGTTATAWAALGDVFAPSPASNGIWKSTDSGANWIKQAGGLPTVNLGRITLGYASSTSGAGATLYAAIADSSTTSSNLLGMFKTVNGGTAWTAVTGPAVTGGFCAHQCFYDMAIGVSPTNPMVVVVGGGAGPNNFTSLFESTNGGGAWTPASKAAGDFSNGSTTTHPHVDTHAIVFSANGATLYVGNDGGMWSTANPVPGAGVSPTWVDLNAQLAITQFYPGPTAAVSDENYGFGGTQDNDVELFQNSLTWQNEFICGDGGFTAIDQTTPTTIYATCDRAAGAKVKKAVMNGQYLTFANSQQFPGFDVAETAISGSGDAMQFIPPIALDDKNPESLYFGTCRVWQTTNAASSLANSFIPLTPTWMPISGDLSNANAPITTSCPSAGGGGNITNLEVAHLSSSVIVAGTSNGKVWETTSGGAIWSEIDASALPARHITAVRTKRSDSTGAIVYVTFSGFDCGGGCSAVGHVFKTTTAGTTSTWTNITGDLPDIPVNDIIVDHIGGAGHDALYIATDVGVFACPDPEAATPCKNWTVIGDGLPNSPVLGLTMRRSSRILHASTHGRSAWQIQLTDVNPLPPLAFLSGATPAAVNVVLGGAGTTPVTITGLNFSPNTQVQFAGSTTGVTTAFVNTTQLNVTLSNTLLQVAGVFPISLTDPAGVDPGSSLLAGGGGPFAVMNPLLDPLTMTPTTALTYTAVPFHLTSATATEPFFPNSVLAFYDTSVPPVLQFQLPTVPTVGTVSSGGTVYDLTTAITQFTTPFTYHVVPYNPTPGGGIDDLAVTAAGAGGPVPFTFTVTANPGPVIQVSSPLSLTVNAVGANTGTTYNFFQVTNLVGATLNITNATITGTNLANFAFIAPGAAPSCNFENTKTVSLTGGSSCFFGLVYTAGTPPGNAQSVATLNIFDNITGSPQLFPITGNISPTAGLVFLSSVNFGAVAVSTTSPTMNATLTNASGSSINVTSVFSITGANLGDFHIVPFVSNGDGNSACPSAVPFALPAAPTPGFACDVTLTFTPSLPAGAESANLSVTASVPVTTFPPNLTGTGIEITSISPSIVATGGPAFTLTVNGGGFAPSAIVNVSSINGTNVIPRLTTFVSANQLLASIPASDIATAGSLAITVTTPVPGGTTSAPKTLIVAQASVATNDNINFALNASTTPARIIEDTTQATIDTGGVADPLPPCGSGSKARSVWFTFTAPANGRVIANSRFSSYTTIGSAWTGTPGSLVAVPGVGACATGNVPGTIPASLLAFNVTSGTKYFVMVTDARTGTSAVGGTLTASLDFASVAPANDDNATPTVIAPASVPFSNTVNTIQATANTGGHADPTLPAGCATGAVGGGQGNTVWYSFTPTASGTVTADTLTSPYETILNVTSGTPNGTQVACNASAGAGIAQSQVSFAANSGTTYFFMVSSFLGDGGTTNFHLNASTVTNNFTNGAGGNLWTTAGNWSLGHVPTSGETVTDTGGLSITLASGAQTVVAVSFLNGGTLTISGGSLTFAGTSTVAALNINGGTLTANGNLTVTGAFSLAGTATSILNGTGTVNLNGAATWSGSSSMAGSGTTNVNAGLTITSSMPFVNGRSLFNNSGSTLTITGGGAGNGLFCNNGATLQNQAGGTWNLQDDNGVFLSAGGNALCNFTNNGTLNRSTTSGTATIHLFSFTNAGTVNVNSGTLLISDNSDIHSGSFVVGSGFTLHLGSGHTFTASSSVSGAGFVVMDNTSQASFAGTYNITGGTSFAGNTLDFTGTVNAVGPLTLTAGTTTISKTGPAGPLSMPSLSCTNSSVGGTSDLTITGAASISNCSVTTTGAFNIAATGTLLITSAAVVPVSDGFQGTTVNLAGAGTWNATADIPLTNGAVFNILSTGSLDVQTDRIMSASAPSTFNNAGLLKKSGVGLGGGSTIIGPAFSNTGTVSINVGTIVFSSTYTQTTGSTILNGGNLSMSGGTLTLTGGTLSGTGTFTGTVNNTGGVVKPGLSPGTLTITGNYTQGAGGALNIEIAGIGAGQIGLLAVSGTATLGGTLNALPFGGFIPPASSNYTFATYGSHTGDFATKNTTVSGVVLAEATNATNATLTAPAGNNPVPTTTSISPTTATAGGTAFTLTVNGTNFIASSVVNFNGVAKTTTFVSATQVTAAILAADIATAGTPSVTVFNPAPGGGTSNAQTFTINNPVPTITSLSPTGVTAGGAGFTLTVNGTGFVATSSVKFNGTARTTTFVSATQVTAAILAADIASAGTPPVTVTNPAPGGGTSNAINFNVSAANNPVPTLTSTSPTTTAAGGAAFTLTLTGTNFIASSTVNFGANPPLVPTTQTSTQLQVTVPAADIATGGNVNVTVTNPAPGGGTTPAQTFTITNPAATLTSFSPTSATAGGAAFTLTINGSNFVSGATGTFNGTARTVTFVNSTQVTMAVTAPDIATAGSFPVVVSNPAPGGGSTGAMLFTVNNVVPTLTSISPTSATAGGAGFTLTLNGTGFVSGSTVKFGVAAPTATFVSATQLTAAITAADIATAGVVNVSVTNPAPGGGTTGTQPFSINNPVPSITSLAPASTTAGGAAFTLTINGANFVSGATGTFNGTARTVTFVSATQVTMAVTAADVATGGSFPVVVSNPGPGGGGSAPSNFTVNNSVPTITSLAPSSATAGGAAFTLTVNGTNLVATSVVNFNGAARTTTFVSATQVTAAITAADIATAGTPSVTVTNPAPGGGTSAGSTFTINNPAPTITTLSPTSATVGGAAFTLTVNGSGFVAGSAVKFNGNAKTTTFVSATQVTAAIMAADIAAAGIFPVTVTNAAPGGGTSTAANFTVNNPVPTITTLVPSSATAGGAAFTLTVNGTNFVSGASVTFGGAARTTTFVNATQVTVAVTAADIATAGTPPVVVTNPAPGGGASAPMTFTVNNPAPTISSLSPTGATAGGAAFTLTVNGTGFLAASQVKFNGNARTTTFVSATQVTAAITAADIAAVGMPPVTVTNPAPGGGTSAAVNFNVSAANNPVPTLTSISPTSATSGSAAFTLTLTGTNFIASSTVSFGANPPLTPTSQTATQIQVTVPVGDIATAGSLNVTVTNPAPGGGTTAAQTFTVNNPAPTITTLSPTSATAGGAAFTLTVNGTGFVAGSAVKFNGNAKTTTFVSATQITAAITAADIATAGSLPVTVTNVAPGGGTSAPTNFTVNNPVPTIATLSPTSATAGGAALTLTVNGTGFVATSVVNFNGAPKTTTFVSATQVTAAITAADIATAGSFPVTVTNPAPGGGASAAVNFAVNNPLPTITSLSPSTLVAGGAAFTLTVNGTNFISTSQVKFNGTARTTAFVSATQITAAILASDIATSGNANVTVTNPTPGGGTTANFVFVITSAPNPVPTLTSIAPTTATAGGAAFTLTVNGTNYVSSSVVNFSGSARTTTVVSATQLTASITAADIAAAGSFPITVFNPAPGGGTSSAINLAVNNPVPAITTLSPATATVGGAAFTLTVNGTGFVNGAVVNFGGAARATTFVNATQVTAAILATDIAATGNIPVTVTNPAPGGGTSVAANFSVNNPPPTITSLAPSSATAGTAAFTLTVNGTGFVAGAVVNFNGAAKTTTFGSATQVTAAILAADIAVGGTVNVTVTNPAPGGGTSAPATFTINNPLPTITTLSPNSATAGGAGFVLTVNGTGYVTGQSLVKFNGNAKTTTVVSPTQLTAPITAADIATGGTFPVTVTNAAPGGGVSAPVNFTVNNPVPTLTSIAPTSGVLNQSVNLTLTGTGFVAGSIVNFGANADSGGVVSNGGNTLTITIPAAQLSVAGPVNVTVKNPAPGGGTTAAQTFTVNNPAPTLTSVAPTSGLLGQAANLTLTGANFIAGSIVNFGANADAGGVVSNGGNTLTITIPAAQLNAAGPVNITVKNPAPGGGTSSAVVFTVNNPAPAVTALAPASANAGGPAFLLTITGTNFITGATVTFGTNPPGAPATLSSTQITVNIPAADIAAGGNFPVVVTNPAPGGGASPVTAASTFAVNNPVPTVTNATVGGNTHASGGAALAMTITGTKFVSTSVVNFNGKAEPTTFVSAMQITAAIPASDVATAGNVNVTVTNPAPMGGTSTPAFVFTVDGFTVSGPANTPVKAGQSATIKITVTPTSLADGYTNTVSFTVAGLPMHSTATFSPTTVMPNGAVATTTLTIMTTARGAAPPSAPVEPPVPPFMRLLPVLWLAAMLAGLYAMQLMRRTPRRRRYAMVAPLALLLLTGAVLAGCSGMSHGTPAGPAQLTITATSGSMVQATPANSVTLTVQ
jgi:hypothetical protein